VGKAGAGGQWTVDRTGFLLVHRGNESNEGFYQAFEIGVLLFLLKV
jgi:hypothetical protein